MAEVRNGQDTAKKKAYLLRERKAREGDASGSMALGAGTHGKTQLVGTHWEGTGREEDMSGGVAIGMGAAVMVVIFGL